MQKSTFSTGGCVIHKITFKAGKLSAWFDDAGKLLDVERFNAAGRGCVVTEDARKQALMAHRILINL